MSFQAPPSYPAYPPHSEHFNSQSSLTINTKTPFVDDSADGTRTPSPTQAEYNYLNDIKEEKTTKQKIQYYAIVAVLLAAAILISVFHTKIINALKPFTDWLHDTKLGPLVVIAILTILSFPPLFGHEIIAMLAGVAWSFPEACVVVAIGTLAGEIANFVVFKYACSVRGSKMEAKDLSYGMLAHVTRTGGFLIILVIRYSAIPPHFATAVFSTVGVNFWLFLGAAVLSLPKAFVPVYVGYAMKPENADDTHAEKIEKIVLIATILVTLISYAWIKRQMKAAKEDFIYLRRKARQGKAGSSNGPQFVSMPAV
ncbi:hypothetical protein DFH08DRAFT_1083387 [Mycena albidolilacea]|uniref:Golgi apparatus membrane protein TVP38 n=1 Tax=Mycena albidolilacea TaxID=1033008 RepID=A0AAD7EM85_9AGAR|nr:hypothetical protein DFH08DRAFT_1083387 [Mycena albidolilacea]